ncbi:MAG: RAMP superfamily CRISPR-associated protein, partial [Campylobacter sp.]|nr:RAMP superfamily CRISPR-associated protein [Campylobacter sp.]
SIFDIAKQDGADDEKIDLSEAIFGYVKGNNALKGRVYFSHFKADVKNIKIEPKEGVFGTPNESYYPNYIEQIGNNGLVSKYYKTLMNKDAKIRGFKRYPLHQEIAKLNKGNGNENVKTKFMPLPTEVKFKGKIVLHNMNSIEIGALLSAITFHGQGDKFFHNIGFAKPYGYGTISINIKNIHGLNNQIIEYLQAFENEMNNFQSNWLESNRLRELFLMADSSINADDKLIYQVLDSDKEINDFTNAKKSKQYLMPYSKLIKANKEDKKTNDKHSNQPHKNKQGSSKSQEKQPFNSLSIDLFNNLSNKDKT